MTFRIRSDAFGPDEVIPVKYTCDGEDISPPLEWTEPPEGTKALALLCDDPDAPRGTWSHWVLLNIPTEFRLLREGVPTEKTLPWGGVQGTNDFGNIGYGGPCPPRGPAHRYMFRLYALDCVLDLPPGVRRQGVLERIRSCLLEETVLIGKYARR